jgi:succinate dehydrogenase / fumarate reductase flavoprotein subunit
VIRSEEGLTEAVGRFDSLARQVPGLATESKTLLFNREWIEALQLRNLVTVMQLSAESALRRRESRGGHYRRDYPLMDNDNWLVNIIARSEDGGGFSLHTEPVVATKVPLPTGVISYEESCRS